MNTVEVRTYKKEKAFQKDANLRAGHGWRVISTDVRKKRWSLLAGVFTRKKVITVTYTRDA